MKAIRTAAFGGPEVLTFEDIADPTPGAGEVVVDIKAAGLNPSDVYMLTGVYLVVPDLPFTPGYDAAGVVSAPGDGVGGLNVGDRVIVGAPLSLDDSRKDLGITGCFAEKVVRRAADLSKLPDNTSFAQGAAIGVPYATAHYGLFGRGRRQGGGNSVHSRCIGRCRHCRDPVGEAGGDAGHRLRWHCTRPRSGKGAWRRSSGQSSRRTGISTRCAKPQTVVRS